MANPKVTSHKVNRANEGWSQTTRRAGMFALAVIAVFGIYEVGSFGRRLGSLGSGTDSKKDLTFLVDSSRYDSEGLIGEGANAYPSGPPTRDLATEEGKKQIAKDFMKWHNKDAQDQMRKAASTSWKLLTTKDKDARPAGLPQFIDPQPHKADWQAYYKALRAENKDAGGNTYPGAGAGKDNSYKLYGPINPGDDAWKKDIISKFCSGSGVDKDNVETQVSCNIIPWVLASKVPKAIADSGIKNSGIYLQIENIGFFVRIAVAVNPEQFKAMQDLAKEPAAIANARV